MQTQAIIQMVDAAKVGNRASLEELDALVEEHPWCSTFQVLKAMALKEKDDIGFKKQLNRAAIAIQDRTKLYNYLVEDSLKTRIEAVETEVSEPKSSEPHSIKGPGKERQSAPERKAAKEERSPAGQTPEQKETTSPESTTGGNEISSSASAEKSSDTDDAVNNQDYAKAASDTSAKATTEEPAAPKASAGKPDEKSAISPEPMEDRVMREAVMHIGELEWETRLSELESEEKDRETAEDTGKQEEPTETKGGDENTSSFGKWLLNLDANKSVEKEKGKEEQRGLIDKFIDNEPTISPVKTAFFSPSQMGKMSLLDDDSFVTETLASIYERQGDFKKAAKAYGNLSLKYPEKKPYFAALKKDAEEKLKKK
jgi:hypothetical protein